MNAGSRNQAWRASSKPQSTQSLYRIELTFDDNRKLADVLGEFDANLALMENKLGLRAVVHGNVVVLEGDRETCLLGKAVLDALYSRASSGATLALGDVEGAIRHLTSNGGSKPGASASPQVAPSFGELK